MKIPLLGAIVLFASTLAQDAVVYPQHGNPKNATPINCQVKDPQMFVYTSNTELWGMMGGQISLSSDVIVLCLGDDTGGKYGAEAMKYKVQIENLQVKEVKEINRVRHAAVRQRRGAREFFTNQWSKFKQFFKRVFGKNSQHPPVVHTPEEQEDGDSDHELLEDLDASELTSLYSAPFQFLQLPDGSVPELRFAESDSDARVRNFKRHLVDAFATRLDAGNRRTRGTLEKSVVGEHTSDYNVTVNGGLANLNAGNSSGEQSGATVVVVQKVVTGADIVELAPSDALNDREGMDLRLEQVQVFREGRMVSASGTHSLALISDPGKRNHRVKRDDEFDVTSFMKSQTTFQMQLQTRQKRSISQIVRLEHEEDVSYLPASRIAESEEISRRDRTRFQPESIAELEQMFENLLKLKDDEYDEKLQEVFEMVEGEIASEANAEQRSVSAAAKRYFSKETVHDLCKTNFPSCKDFMQLLALVGGPEVEDIYLSFLFGDPPLLSSTETRIVADLASDVSRPSTDFLLSLTSLVANGTLAREASGTLCISLGHLASKASHHRDLGRIPTLFVALLRDNVAECEPNAFAVDVLEAIGNLRSPDVVSDVIQLSTACKESKILQTASIHALRHSSHLDAVRLWMEDFVKSGDCDLIREVVGALLDKVQEQALTAGDTHWPRFGFNSLDRLLRERLAASQCPFEDVLLYFRRKRDPEANEIARTHFVPESGPWDTPSGTRQRRALWDDLNCRRWSEEGEERYVAIQDREEFASDRATYNSRRSCLGFKRLGVKGANAEIYAGMFAGIKEPSEPPKYKLFTKFVSQLNFLGQQMEIGSFRFYHQNGKMNTYVKILGRTRQEFSHEGCTPTDLMYRPLRHLPLFLVNVGVAQLSLGVQVSSQLGVSTLCPGAGEVYQLQPLASMRVGGEATGTVLFIRGGVNLGGNFNYRLQFTFTPSPNMCLKGSHGHDPMNIGFETYYQLWNKVKDDWGKARSWRPGFVTWNLTKGGVQPWFDDTCIVKSAASLNTDREVE